MIEVLKAIVLGIIQGITEWLPISSTGHMILVDEFLKLGMSAEFKSMFIVLIQLGSIFAVVVLYWNRLFPFKIKGGFGFKEGALSMWLKIIVACIPAGIVGVLFDDRLDELFYNNITVAVMLILFGILFIVIENMSKTDKKDSIADITYVDAMVIGIFQLIAAVFPGTSRSGATIIGSLTRGISRTTAAEFTFFLAVPTMLGASLLKMVKFGFSFTGLEIAVLLVGMVTAFLVSIAVIRKLMEYVKNHDFKPFGWYRIVLGVVVILYFYVFKK